MTNNIISNNSALRGGGISVSVGDGGTFDLTNNTISNNSDRLTGGDIKFRLRENNETAKFGGVAKKDMNGRHL